MYWSSALARVTLSTMKRISNCLVKSRLVEVKVACLSQRHYCQVVACCMLHACLVACCMHAWHVHAKLVCMHAKSRVRCYWSLKSSSISQLKYEVELWLKQANKLLFRAIHFSSSTFISRGRPLSSTQFDMQVKGEAIDDHISDKETTYQRNISLLYINNRGYILEAHINNISVLYINNRSNISEAYFNKVS